MEAVQFAATLTYGLLAYTLGAVAAAIVSVPTAGPGFLWPSYLLLGFSVITLCAALGHLVGRWSRSIFMAPVICALGCFVAIGAIGSPRGLGLFVLSGEPNVVVNTWPLVARISLATALLFAAIVLPDRQKRQRFRWPQTFGARVAASCAGFAVLVAFSSLIFAGPIRVDRAATDSPLCSTSSPRVCIWPEDRKYLPELTAMAERLDAVPQKWLNLPDTFYQSGLRPDPRYIPIDFSFSEGQLWFAAPNFAGVVIQRSITDKCEERSRVSAQKYSDAILQLDLWLEFRLMGSSKLSINSTLSDAQLSEPQRIVQASEGEQASWVDKQLKVIHNLPCQ
ncbi:MULTISPECIES: hypothetical protein [Streptomyces]|nr:MULTISPECIES: hypothetical protein [Streptomyces]MYS93809.1 hypothetical protein [Streptomyces sp. SID5464]